MKAINLVGLFFLLFTFFIGCNNSPMGTIGPPQIPLPFFFDNPAWHPKGKWIAVEHSDSVDTDSDGRFDQKFGGIWLVHAGTAEKQPLLKGFGNPAWSPDGRKLALEKGGQIFTIEVASLEPARVDTNSFFQLTNEGGNFFPAWGPNGEWIAYDSNVDDTKYDIWIMKSNGKSKNNISGESDSSDQGGWRMPNWSPDGKIAHIRYLVGVFSSEIFTMSSNGNNPIRLTKNDATDFNPKYSPDGTKIAFYSKPRTGPESVIRMISIDGSNLRTVSPEYAWQFDWSPDGSKFVFLFWDGLNDRPGNGELWLINADGSGLRQLTHFKDKSSNQINQKGGVL